MADSAFARRVKRRVSARIHEFFAVCPPGLRQVCAQELTGLDAGIHNIQSVAGGVAFHSRIMDACLANLWLRAPSRILMRLARFRATRFSILEKKLSDIDWEIFLPAGNDPIIQVTAHTSRLYHSDAIADRCRLVVRAALGTGQRRNNTADPPSVSQTIMIRAENDRFEISLDMSGPPLFKRGIKKQVASAPLRENLAFAILNAAGFTDQDVLMDPMCGSGTFAIEGAMIQARVPPGFHRGFAFETWPGVSPASFAHSRARAAQQFSKVHAIFAFDVDPKAMHILSANLAGHEFLAPVQASRLDFFDLVPARFSKRKGVLVLNPPYGKRMENHMDTPAFYREITRKLAADFKGWRIGLIYPGKQFRHMNFLNLRPFPFFHGGLYLAAGIGTV
ncbi:MAG: RNA methyltransferase [Desulfotignum sp.]|nr:RNA methyltransferase [Desulfotignum sp.]